MPGWTVEAVSSGLDGNHTITITPPTGHTYLSRAPNEASISDQRLVCGREPGAIVGNGLKGRV
jgi:hypothetical protein